MTIQPFTSRDFQVFALPGFAERMAAIRSQVSPKLEALGEALRPLVARAVGGEVYPHVARHARRTVNPPGDTWVAFGPERRGYKKTQHFKLAISRHCLRLLFEVGPEYADKPRWARAFRRELPRLARDLRAAPGLGWFRNEHDEEAAVLLAELDEAGWLQLAEALTRTRDGQLVLGRRVQAAEAARWRPADYERAAAETFGALAACFRLP